MKFSIRIMVLCFGAALPVRSEVGLKGVVMNLHAGQSVKTVETSLRALRSIGGRHVLFRFCEYQYDAQSDSIAPLPTQTPPYRLIERASHLATTLGMTFSYMPIVLLEKPASKEEWRGRLRPRDKARWLGEYRGMTLKYARLAQRTGALALSIGSELSWAEYEVDFWLDLIRATRAVFLGKLFYSFNWDHLSTTAAWRKLDFLGVTGYFEIAHRPEEPLTKWQVAARWAAIPAPTTRWGSLMRKKNAYTEIGYPSRQGALWDPWDHDLSPRPYDPQAQKRAFQGFIASLRHTDVEGVFFYEWVAPIEKGDRGYSPWGKPAQGVWRSWFSHQKATSSIDSVKGKASPTPKSPSRLKKRR